VDVAAERHDVTSPRGVNLDLVAACVGTFPDDGPTDAR
jgi:hypothetical protein